MKRLFWSRASYIHFNKQASWNVHVPSQSCYTLTSMKTTPNILFLNQMTQYRKKLTVHEIVLQATLYRNKAQPSNICTWTCLISVWTFLINVSPCYCCKMFYSKAPVVLAFNHCWSSSLLPYLLFSLRSMHISPCCLYKKEPFKNCC